MYLVEIEDDVLLNKKEYEGNGNVIMLLDKYAGRSCHNGECECESYDGVVSPCRYEDMYDTLQAGNIQNGQIVLDLPEKIDNKYLRGYYQSCNVKYEPSCELNVVPPNLMLGGIIDKVEVTIPNTIPGRNYCYLGSNLTKLGERTGFAWFMYASVSGKITGTTTYYSSTGNYNMNLSQGWNLIYVYFGSNKNIEYWVTGLPTGSTLEWWLDCDD